jgi:hypothetical protein
VKIVDIITEKSAKGKSTMVSKDLTSDLTDFRRSSFPARKEADGDVNQKNNRH